MTIADKLKILRGKTVGYIPPLTADDRDEDYYYDDPQNDEPDAFEEAMDDCSGLWDGGVFLCMAAGSEECEFECPFSNDIGKTAKQIETEVYEEKR